MGPRDHQDCKETLVLRDLLDCKELKAVQAHLDRSASLEVEVIGRIELCRIIADTCERHSAVLCGCSIKTCADYNAHTHTHPFSGPLSGTTRVSRYQKGKTSLDFTEARDSEWQWHQLGHMQVCTLLQTDNHASTLPLRFLQAGCPSCRPINSVKALEANVLTTKVLFFYPPI